MHSPKVKSLEKTQTGIAFTVQCEEYEESFHFQNVGLYTPTELKAKVETALATAQEHHQHKVAGEDHLETLLKQFANGIPNCAECG